MSALNYKKTTNSPRRRDKEVEAALKKVEKSMGKASAIRPILCPVRPPPAARCPCRADGHGAHLGLNDETVEGIIASPATIVRLGFYRRFVQMYGDVVMGLKPEDRTRTIRLRK
jgi:pyruvate,orthophosphate dikinase